MSHDNVEIVRRGLEAFNRGDWEVSMAELHERAVWVPSPAFPDTAPITVAPGGIPSFARNSASGVPERRKNFESIALRIHIMRRGSTLYRLMMSRMVSDTISTRS